jgi:hypothetical protein
MGDLNYRIDLNLTNGTARKALAAPKKGKGGKGKGRNRTASDPTQDEVELDPDVHHTQVLKLIHAKDWGALMAADQLRFCQANGEAFAGFVEGPYRFSPTFKVERRPGTHHKKKRIPSYCDRVLWKSMPPLAANVTQSFLCSAPNVSTSDHKPVYAGFDITPSLPIGRLQPGEQPPLVRLDQVVVNGVSNTDRVYLVFQTNPSGLLGEKPPKTATTPSSKSASVPHRLCASWSDSEIPLLRPLVNDASALERVTLIIAVYDADVLTRDDLLGVVRVPLSRRRTSGGGSAKSNHSYVLSVDQPLVKGNVSADMGTFRARLAVTFGAQLQSALDAAISVNAGRDANKKGGCCTIL